jgi:ribosome-binding ATPase
MSLKIGIVGLPNVGKSTLFNALTRTRNAEAQNYPFCTIDPNIGIVEVPDTRIKKLAELSSSEKIIPSIIEFVDIAGLVKGASEGEGLGNKFLSHIRECDAIGHVVRVFEDPDVIHVHGDINPKQDREIIESEMILSDMQTLEKRIDKARTEAKSGNKDKKEYLELLESLMKELEKGVLASNIDFSKEEKLALRDLHLLTIKPHLYFINVPEAEVSDISKEKYGKLLEVGQTEKIIPICAKLEQDLSELKEDEAMEYLNELGVEDTGLSHLIQSAYKILNLITFFTSGPKETRAWTVKDGALAPQAAGVIHTDFEKGFIKAEVVSSDDFISSGGEQKAKEKGLLRIEGKEYKVKDGDIMHFRFSK